MRFLVKYRLYLKELRPFYTVQGMVWILVTISSVLALINPLLMQIIIDRVLLQRELSLLKVIIVVLIIFFFINLLILFVSGYLTHYVGQVIAVTFRRKMAAHIQRVFFVEKETTDAGDFISKITDDVNTLSTFMSSTLLSILNSSMNMLATLALMFWFSWRLSVVAITVTLLQLWISKRFVNITRDNELAVRTKASEHISFLKNLFSGMQAIKAYHSEKAMDRTYFSLLRSITNLQFKGFFIQFTYSSLVSFVSFIGSILIFSFGVFEILQGRMSIGVLFVFDSVSERFYVFAKELVDLNVNLQAVSVAFQRVNSIFSLKKEPSDASIKLPDASAKDEMPVLELKKLCFAYRSTPDILIFQDASYSFEQGHHYALVAPSGQGKSTLIKLVLGFYPQSSGELFFRGHPYKEVGMAQIRRRITTVLQDDDLLDGTLEENLRMGDRTLCRFEINRIIKLCKLEDLVNSLPDGIQTRLGERGITVSGGQKQRIQLARGLLRRSDLYFIDEGFSSMDDMLEQELVQLVRRELKDKTVVFITHNLELVQGVETILTLHNGSLLEGTASGSDRFKEEGEA